MNTKKLLNRLKKRMELEKKYDSLSLADKYYYNKLLDRIDYDYSFILLLPIKIFFLLLILFSILSISLDYPQLILIILKPLGTATIITMMFFMVTFFILYIIKNKKLWELSEKLLLGKKK